VNWRGSGRNWLCPEGVGGRRIASGVTGFRLGTSCPECGVLRIRVACWVGKLCVAVVAAVQMRSAVCCLRTGASASHSRRICVN
jgi:hypothetical protein